MTRRDPSIVALVGPGELDGEGVAVSIVHGAILGPASAQSAAAISLGAIARAHGARFVAVSRPSRLTGATVRTLAGAEKWMWAPEGDYLGAYIDEIGSTPRSSFRPLDLDAFLSEARTILVGHVAADAAE